VARSKKPPSPSDPAALLSAGGEAHTAAKGLLPEAVQVRLAMIVLKLAARFESLLDDPGYRPSPSDLTGIFAAVRGVAQLQMFLPSAEAKIKALKTELETMEARLLGMLTNG